MASYGRQPLEIANRYAACAPSWNRGLRSANYPSSFGSYRLYMDLQLTYNILKYRPNIFRSLYILEEVRHNIDELFSKENSLTRRNFPENSGSFCSSFHVLRQLWLLI